MSKKVRPNYYKRKHQVQPEPAPEAQGTSEESTNKKSNAKKKEE